MPLTKEDILPVLQSITDPATGRTLGETRSITKVASCDGHVAIELAAMENEAHRQRVKALTDAAVRRKAAAAGELIHSLTIEFTDGRGGVTTVAQPAGIPMKQGSSSPATSSGSARPGSPSMPGVRHIIAVGAGKGGVGKSTVSVNLAVGLARGGHAVGLLDGDIYGPSIPTLLGLERLDVAVHKSMLQPFFVHGIKTMTIGKLVEADKPLIWRGPMAHGAFKQLAEQTEWGELDYLIVDLPPGTGDVSLTMAQMLSVTGAVIVCTPQKVAQDDAVRAARMFQTLNIPLLGVVENMSYFIGDDGREYDLFGRGGAEQMAQRLGLPFLGAVPIHMELRVNSDAGNPSANFTGNHTLGAALERMVKRVEDEVALAVLRGGAGGPNAGPVLKVS